MLSKYIFNASRLQRRYDFMLFLSPLFGEDSVVVESGSNGLKPPFNTISIKQGSVVVSFSFRYSNCLFRELLQVDKDMFGGWLNKH